MTSESQGMFWVNIRRATTPTRRILAETVVCASVVLLMASSGCATIIHGKWQTAQFTSTPAGAEVHYRGQLRGTTPCSVEIRRHLVAQTVRLSMTGRDDQFIRTKNGMSLVSVFGNALLGGLVGIVVDLITGSAGALWKDEYHVEFSAPIDTPQVSQRSHAAVLPAANSELVKPPSFYKGMTQTQVRDKLGNPDEISRSTKSEIWYFGDSYFGFDHAGLLVLWDYIEA